MIESIGVLALVAAIAAAVAHVRIDRLRGQLKVVHLVSVADREQCAQRYAELDKSKANARRPRVRNVKTSEPLP